MATKNGQLNGAVKPFRAMNKTELLDEVGWRDTALDLFQERLAVLELALDDVGWLRETMVSEREFSRLGLRTILRIARMMWLKNPLIRRATQVQAHYVFGQGVSITAKHPLVNEVIQSFLDDPKNQTELTSHKARVGKETELQVTGNLFFVLFTNLATGHVRIRTIPAAEIEDIISNPEDAKDPWYYKRLSTRNDLDTLTGAVTPVQTTEYYPDWRHKPTQKVATIGGHPVNWDSPVYHLPVGNLPDMKFGVPEIYPILDWAKAIKEDLEDFATIRRALSRFAWHLQTQGGKTGIAAAKKKLGTTLASGGGVNPETNPPPVVGSTFISSDSVKMDPIKTAGIQPNPEDSRRLWLMVSAGSGLPETFFGDVGRGNLATAKAMDRPTELKMSDRQTLWKDTLQDILGYVIDRAALAPNSDLGGTVQPNRAGDPIVVLGNDLDTGEPIDRHVDVTFPDILEHDAGERVGAIVNAATLGGHPASGTLSPKMIATLLMQALGVDDIDEELQALFPDDGSGERVPATPQAEAFTEALRELRAAVRKVVEKGAVE